MGYKSGEMAKMRYDVVTRMLALHFSDKNVETISDIGAGLGMFWLSEADSGGLDRLLKQMPDLKHVRLIDYYKPYFDRLTTNTQRLNELAKGRVKFEFVKLNFIEDVLPSTDVTIEIGAMNYWNVLQTVGTLNKIHESSRKGYVIETNLQTAHTNVDAENWNPSIGLMYETLYTLALSDGASRVHAEFFKKWTAVFGVVKPELTVT
jgi:hypothetical protein